MIQGRSTLIVYNFSLDEDSNLELVLCPRLLHKSLYRLIIEIGMRPRDSLLDVWETEDRGPATSFHSLEESHSRISIVAGQFKRTETWPEIRGAMGEIQLCDYTRDNASATRLFIRRLIEEVQPVRAKLLVISRGPGWEELDVLETIKWKREKMPLPF